MRSVLPDSLFGQLMTALLAAIVVSTLIVALLIARERRDLTFWRSEAAEVLSTIAATSSELAAMSPAARAEALAALHAQSPILMRERTAAAEVSPEDVAEAARAYEARLQNEFRGRFRVLVRPATPDDSDVIRIGMERPPSLVRRGDGEEALGESSSENLQPRAIRRPGAPGTLPAALDGLLDVGINLPDGAAITFRTAVPQPPPPLPRRIFLELGGLTLLLGAVLFVMARGITNPLSDLARAADAMGRGGRVAPLRERGARELREATRAFNAMQERLHRYLDSRTRVLAAMSHDLRTPLTRLRLRAESIDGETDRARFVADLEEMDQMVSNALDLFRGIDREEELTAFAIRDLLEELRTEFAELGAALLVRGEARPMEGRRRAIKRCLTNLLTNAVKFGTAPVIVVEDGDPLVIRIRDDGPGIPEEALERVFEPFFRLEASRNADTGGAGLGLSIARDIAQAHGGSLVLRNLHPRGLEAALALPRR